MLQRAASNAYSWWWASHIRTKQSKWMEQNLQDMEEKVAITLKLIEEDGDSFAKRAEMYYKRRPELINFVEESYRAYRALAERYDHLSSELQNANNTIASVFPDQVQFAMDDDDDDDNTPRVQKRPPPEMFGSNIPKVPNMPTKEFKRSLTSSKKKLLPSKSTRKTSAVTVVKSGLNKPEGLKKIDNLQKQILALQTEKEFVKSSYESKLAKYWEIENQIVEVQQKVCGLEDEFGEGMVIEDEEARTLMAAAAINSCQETLAQLEEKQERSAEQAKAEHERIKYARNKLASFKNGSVGNETSQKDSNENVESVKAVEDAGRLDQEVKSATQKREEFGVLEQKIKEHFEVGSNASLTVTEMAEKIDELVNKVVSLETAVSSQTSLLQRLRTETDELQVQIQNLEDDKATLINEKSELSIKLMEMDKKLQGLEELNSNLEEQNNNLQTIKARCNLDHLSDIRQSVKPDEELEHSSKPKEESLVQTNLQKQTEEQEGTVNPSDGLKKQHSVKLSEDVVTNSLEKVEKSLVQADSQQQIEGQEEGAANPGDRNLTEDFEKLHSEKLNGEFEVSDEIQNEEKSMVKVESRKDFKEEVQTEEVNGIKEHDVSATTGNEGEVVSQSQGNGEPGDLLEKSQDQITQEKVDKQVSTLPLLAPPSVENHVVETKQDDEPDWKQLFMNGMENREKVLLTEYTTVLRNFKELKKKLGEGDTKTEDSNIQMTMKLKEMKGVNAMKDEEIRSLRQKLSFLQQGFDESSNLDYQKATVIERAQTRSAESEEDVRVIEVVDQHENTSPIEEKFRMDIDELLEENLDFWLRFSSSFHQVQKFETEVQDLQSEVSKVEEKQKKNEGSGSLKYSLKSDVRPLYKHLREIQTELTVWMEKSALLKEELKSRFSSLCNIQEDITKALKVSAEDDDFKFTSYQAAKFQGEVLNMKQENNKVADELQASLDHVTNLQLEVERTLALLSEEFGLSGSKSSPNIDLQRSESKTRVPLRSFIFGVKPKKQRASFFASCMHPALQRKYNNRRSSLNE
ncbi:hypothetical protein Dsin_015866 [Dipteronia sinensis]|uniref:NAB domain-containing protein n=1 Tax=Dipteronia sinensis TaxID=43782 RepID=A0AAE0E5F6_9ROSI|nr:hypothetical protein Dsin_015866 [Dipteronia sinensis]